MITFTGRHIDHENFSKDNIDLVDIAISLSAQRRYAGHTAVPFSVAQHLILCVMMAELLFEDEETREKVKKAVFLHDVEETWMQDIIYDIKRKFTLGKFKKVSNKVSSVVYEFFGCKELYEDKDIMKHVHVIDRIVYHFEASHLLPTYDMKNYDWSDDEKAAIHNLTMRDFSIPLDLIHMKEEEVAQHTLEILQVMHTEGRLGQGISPDNSKPQHQEDPENIDPYGPNNPPVQP